MQRIGESRWRPLELCWWPKQTALPAKGKEYPGLGCMRLRDKPPKAQQQQPVGAHRALIPMGKVKAAPAPVKLAKQSAADTDAASKIGGLKLKAQQHFLAKDFEQAVTAYGDAIKLLPAGSAEQADALLKRAGCYLQLKKYADAANDSSVVLQHSPGHAGALKTRSKALQGQGKLRQALADLERLNAGDHGSKDSREQERTLRAQLSSRPSSAPPGAQVPSPSQPMVIPVKASLGADTRLLYLDVAALNYAGVMQAVRAKFPEAGPFLLKYRDADGELLTLTCKQDLQAALNLMMLTLQKQLQGGVPRLPGQGPTPLKLHVQPVAREALVPRPPASEYAELGMQDPAAAAGGYEVEEWVMDFVRIFSEVTGLDPGVHLDGSQAGQEAVQRGVQAALDSPAADEALDLAAEHFRDAVVSTLVQWANIYVIKAERRLQALQKASGSATAVVPEGEELEAVMQLFDKSKAKLEEALAVHRDSWEAVAHLAQLEWDRAKAKLGYSLPAVTVPDSARETGKSQEQLAAEVQAAHNKRLAELLGGMPTEHVLQVVQPHLDACSATFERALALAQATQAAKEAREAKRAAASPATAAAPDAATATTSAADAASGSDSSAAPAAAASSAGGEGGTEETAGSSSSSAASTPPFNVLIMHGNILYDWSQVLAVTGAAPWRPVLDEATAKFRSSGAPEGDVRAALKNHMRVEELDLGPDPDLEVEASVKPPASGPAAAPEPAAAAVAPVPAPSPAAAAPSSPQPESNPKAPVPPGTPAPAPEAKGLPSLRLSKPSAKK
ncbi:hypothetical protein QJQ45_028029 [Haematococcus lacustris]|nr:hypothetical protein QJQ45_028029 [Haematococcus lacustris]